MTTYEPKVGDRVRATLTYEGVVKGLPAMGGQHVRLEVADYHTDPSRYLDVNLWSFEKLQDPEPTWVNGDVIKIPGCGDSTLICMKIPNKWVVHDALPMRGGWVTEMWEDGKVKILYKADAGKADGQSDGVTAIACTPNQDR